MRLMFKAVTGYVYFLQMGFVGPIKIGFTKDIGKRMVQLQTGSPYPLVLLCVFPGCEEEESILHYALREYRMAGEWFLPARAVMAEIEEQQRINAQDGFSSPSETDIGDWSLTSERWQVMNHFNGEADNYVIKEEVKEGFE